jgi:hypothetical protein
MPHSTGGGAVQSTVSLLPPQKVDEAAKASRKNCTSNDTVVAPKPFVLPNQSI